MEQNLENSKNNLDNKTKNEIKLDTEKKEEGSAQEESNTNNQNEIVINESKKVMYKPVEN